MQFKSEGYLLAEFLLARGRSIFVLLRASADQLSPMHIIGGDLIYYSKSTDLNVNLSKKTTFTETSRIKLEQISSLAKPLG